MKNQVLSIEQMQKLKELGVDINKASMCYISKYPSCDFDDGDSIVVVSKDFNKRLYNEFGPAFTLQDIIELLPHNIYDGLNKKYSLVIQVNIVNCFIIHYLSFGKSIDELIHFYDYDIIDAVYKMLVWVTEKGYLKTK